MLDLSYSDEIYTVSQLNHQTRSLIEKNLGKIWIEGEISNFMMPNSGHWYFSLKDAEAQVRCAMFKMQNNRLNWKPMDGAHVLMHAQVSLYEGRGEFQLIAEHLEDIGQGRLRQAFEATKARLREEGLFDNAKKKSLPEFPKCIGIVTSATGAAIQDILSVLARRYPIAPVRVYSAQVQGDKAAQSIVKALVFANREKKCDVIILARGGGSLEDLWPFNEESVARAIFSSKIPIVSGVGHETDITIADYVADVRAATPSVAAESITPNKDAWLQTLQRMLQQISNRVYKFIENSKAQFLHFEKHLQHLHPLKKLAEKSQQIDHLEMALIRLQNERLLKYRNQLSLLITQINALNPLALIERGYSIVRKKTNGAILKNVESVSENDKVEIILKTGQLICTIDQIIKKHIS